MTKLNRSISPAPAGGGPAGWGGIVLAWRKVFPRDRQSDVRRKQLGAEGRDALENLLDAAWINDGELPADDDTLAMLSMTGPRWPQIAPKVLAFFERRGDAYVNQALLDEIADAKRLVAAYQERARLGAAARWGHASGNASSIPASNAGTHAWDVPPSAVSRQPSDIQPLEDSRQPKRRIDGGGVEGKSARASETSDVHDEPDKLLKLAAEYVEHVSGENEDEFLQAHGVDAASESTKAEWAKRVRAARIAQRARRVDVSDVETAHRARVSIERSEAQREADKLFRKPGESGERREER